MFTQAIWQVELTPPLQKVFQSIKEAHPEWEISNIVTIVFDFSEAQANALITATREHAKKYVGDFLEKTAEEFIKELFRGCEVHWNRSVGWVVIVLRQSHGTDDADKFIKMCWGILNEQSRPSVTETFDAIVKQRSTFGGSAKWWNREKVLRMLTHAYSQKTLFGWTRNATSNAAEAGNRPVADLKSASQWVVFERAWHWDCIHLHGARRHGVK